MRTWTGTVTVVTNKPEAPIGVVVQAENPWIAARRAVEAASKKRHARGGGKQKRITEWTIKLKAGATIKPPDAIERAADREAHEASERDGTHL